MKVGDIMSTNVVTVTEDSLVDDAKKIMEAHRIRRLPVMKKDNWWAWSPNICSWRQRPRQLPL